MASRKVVQDEDQANTCDCGILKMRQRYEVAKAMSVVRTAMSTTLILVTLGIFETQRTLEG